VNTADKSIWSSVAGENGYLSSDTDLDSQVDNKDKNDIWTGNLNEQTKVPN
jgi:pyocin large subunit-like protein